MVHLVRAQNGTEPFVRFLESYRQNPGGIEHDLLIVFKGFDHLQDIAKYQSLLTQVQYSTLQVSDDGFDFQAYFSVVKQCSEQYQYFCFLNSYSVVQDVDWLKKLYGNITRPNVGMVGATGSWESHRLGLPSWKMPYAISNESYKTDGKSLLVALSEGWRQLPFFLSFDLFPNYHVRTNAFMISSELLKTIKCPVMHTKRDAYRMESGKKGLTRQILARGKRVLIVGKDGIGYEKEGWHESNTFWQSDQGNLLVADNQTREYMAGDAEFRRDLSTRAWGSHCLDTHSTGSNKQS